MNFNFFLLILRTFFLIKKNPTMDFFSSSLEITTRYAETDQMGFVHHGNYTHYFELGRIDWLKKLGFSYKKIRERFGEGRQPLPELQGGFVGDAAPPNGRRRNAL